MRDRHLLSCTAAALFCLLPIAGQSALAADWQGSYSAQGSCFCIGQLPAHISTKIIPTPVGGKTVSQICKRIGNGPGLKKTNGIFNHPFYEDAQCGHGPFVDETASLNADCAGTIGDQADSCQPIGPRWNLQVAFDSSSKLPVAQASNNASQLASPAAAKPTVPDQIEPDKALATNSIPAVVEKVVSANTSSVSLKEFSGKSVTIGGQKYLQARADLPASGGRSGSRIVLDDVVYLKADATLDVNDLYRSPALSAASPLEAEPLDKARIKIDQDSADNASTKEDLRKIAAAKAEQQKADKAAAARLAAAREEAAREEARRVEARRRQEQLERARLTAERAREKIASEQLVKNTKPAADSGNSTDQDIALSEKTLQEKPDSSKSEAVNEASKSVDTSARGASNVSAESILAALRLPQNVRASSRNFNYFEAVPASYDIGGAGIMFEGSGQTRARFQFLGRLGVSDEYQEVMFGGGYYLTPANASRLTVILSAGIEYGSFELRDEERAPGVTVDFDDSGVHLGLASRIVLNNKFELKGGVGYSSFFGGDAMMFGGAYYHITPRLDALTRFEFGDNDLFGFGIRYYY